MSLIIASDLAKSFGPDDIFEGISLSIPHGARIAIVGANGVGKTTLLRILVGEDFPSAGSVQHARDLVIGYLPQVATLSKEGTLWTHCLAVFEDLLTLQDELETCVAAMADPELAEDALTRYGNLEQAFEQRGGYTYEVHIKHILSVLGFDEIDYHRPLASFRAGSDAGAAGYDPVREPRCDDPGRTDQSPRHPVCGVAESFLKDWEGALVVVSHDRYFLDQVANTIWEMTPSLEIYRGNYSAYLAQREERYTVAWRNTKRRPLSLKKSKNSSGGISPGKIPARQRSSTPPERLLEDARLAPAA